MSRVFLIATLLVVAFFMGVVIYLLKKRMIYLKYALLWIFTGVCMIIIAVFPKVLGALFDLLGIQVYSNGIFAILLFFMLIILMSLTSIVSGLNQKNRRLTQELALLEKRVRELEEEKDDSRS